MSSFDAWPRIPPLVLSFAYKYPRFARFSERRVFRVVFSHLCSLVIPFFVFLLFRKSCNRKESDHRIEEKVLVIEGDTL